jgi:hypothetical protein
LLLESRGLTRGVACGRPLSKALKDRPVWFKTNATWKEEAETAALDNLGKPYGWGNSLRAAFGLRTRDHSYECAQYVIKVLQASGVSLPDELIATPVELSKHFGEQGVVLKSQAAPLSKAAST